MTMTPPRGCQRVIPYIAYNDAPAAIEFLRSAFGFEERFRMPMPDGRVGHCEMGYEDNVLMLASAYPEIGLSSPMDLPSISAQIVCYVDDVDSHFARAKEAGATITTEPADMPYGDRSYRAMDPEGHRWIFSTVVSQASPEHA